MKIKKFLKNEKGDILIIFALIFTLFLGFLAFVVDIGMMYLYRARMLEIAHIMRDTRFTKNTHITELIYNSNTPGKYLADMLSDYARKNGFRGKITITFEEDVPTTNKRNYTIKIELEDEYKTTVLRALGINEMNVKITVNGSAWKEGTNIWYPNGSSWRYYQKVFPALP